MSSMRASNRTANLHTSIMDFRGVDSSRILILRGGIPRPMGDLPESLSRAILVRIILVGRLGNNYTYIMCIYIYIYLCLVIYRYIYIERERDVRIYIYIYMYHPPSRALTSASDAVRLTLLTKTFFS